MGSEKLLLQLLYIYEKNVEFIDNFLNNDTVRGADRAYLSETRCHFQNEINFIINHLPNDAISIENVPKIVLVRNGDGICNGSDPLLTVDGILLIKRINDCKECKWLSSKDARFVDFLYEDMDDFNESIINTLLEADIILWLRNQKDMMVGVNCLLYDVCNRIGPDVVDKIKYIWYNESEHEFKYTHSVGGDKDGSK